MAKVGLKTFPLSVDDSDELKLVEDEFGLRGWAVAVKLFQYIHSCGFYVKWDIDVELLFIREKQLKELGRSFVSEVVACCVRRGVFDKDLFDKYKILTSKNLQETFLNATKRNKEVIIEERYALPIVYTFIENVNKSGKNVNIFFKNADISEQNKNIKLKSNSNELQEERKKESIYKNQAPREKPADDAPLEDWNRWERHRSHADVMDEMGVMGTYRNTLEKFLRHCYANGQVIINDRLIDIICRLNDYYDDDEQGKINSLERAIQGGYFDIKEGR